MLGQGVAVKALAHVSGDGLMNLTRVAAEVGFVIDALPPIPPISMTLAKDRSSSLTERVPAPDGQVFLIRSVRRASATCAGSASTPVDRYVVSTGWARFATITPPTSSH